MYKNVQGIVLNKYDINDYDKIIVLYTLQFGKVKVMFKSVKKHNAKLLALTDIGNEIEAQVYFIKNFNGNYRSKVIGGKVLLNCDNTKLFYDKYLNLCRVLEIMDSFTLDLISDEKKYELLKRVIKVLGNSQNPEKVFIAFVLRFINLCGYKPHLYNCVICKSDLNSLSVGFDFINSGVLCTNCFKKKDFSFDNKMKVSKKSIELLQKFYKISGEEADNLQIEQEIFEEIKKIIYKYLCNYAHYNLKTIN